MEISVDSIERAIEMIEGDGVTIWVKTNGMIGLHGPKLGNQRAVQLIQGRQEEVIAYLRRRQAVVDGSAHESEDIEIGDTDGRDIEIDKLKVWAAQRPVIFHWDDKACARLRETMGPGDRIEPCYAMSCFVRKPSGALVQVDKQGKVLR